MEVVLIQVSFLTISFRQKNKNELMEYHGIFIPFINRVYSKCESTIFPFFGSLGLLALYLQTFVKTKIFSDNSNLTNLVDFPRLHENGKWIKYVYDRFYTLFKKWSCCSTLLW